MGCFEGECWQEIFKDCCKCCCCCKSVQLTFKCGSPKSEFEQGCDCGNSEFLKGGFEFPKFEIKIQDTGKACSIPCGEVIVTVRSTCCLKCVGNSIEAIGNGTVSASVDSGSVDQCEPWVVQINGSSGPVAVFDKQPVNVTLTSNGDCDCCCEDPTCSCCEEFPDCDSSSLKYTYKNGKIYIDTKYLKDKLEAIKQARSLSPTSRPIEKQTRPIDPKRRKIF